MRVREKVRIELNPELVEMTYELILREIKDKAYTEKMDLRLIELLFKFARGCHHKIPPAQKIKQPAIRA